MYGIKPESDLSRLNNRQREAAKKVRTYEMEEIYVERTLTEKIQDFTVDKKLQTETHEKQVEIPRG